ncbi:MAG: hypothetical protein ACOC80_14075, partial [Petrotogales bacterium]
MKKTNILKEAGVLLVAIVVVFSTVAIANTEPENILITSASNGESFYEGASRGDVVWDNGMNYTGILSAQNFTNYDILSEPADDFHFEEDTEVADVHWMAGIWNPGQNVSWPWTIRFYSDKGDGTAPGTMIYEETFPEASIDSTFVEITPSEIHVWLLKIDLTDPIMFQGCEKYWLSVQGIGDYPPQSGWMRHDNETILHEAVFKSEYFGFPDWTPVSDPDLLGWPADMCFQLTAEGPEPIPDLCCEGSLSWDNVKPGSTVNGTFQVCNCGEDGSLLNWQLLEEPSWGIWEVEPDSGTDLAAGDCVTITVNVTAPEDKNAEFTGNITMVNSDNESDFCKIP